MADQYLGKLLADRELVLIEAKQHPIAVVKFALKPILLVGLVILLFIFNQAISLGFLNELVRWVLLIVAVVAIIWLPIDIVQWYSRRYVLTNRRVIRLYGAVSKHSLDSSLEHVNDIQSTQSFFGRTLGYTDLTIYTASDHADETFGQLIDGLQFKKAVLDAKEALRKGAPLTGLPEGFVVRGGTNEASIRAYQKEVEASSGTAPVAATVPGAAADSPDVPPVPEAHEGSAPGALESTPEVTTTKATTTDPGSAGEPPASGS